MNTKLSMGIRWIIATFGIALFAIGVHLVGFRPPASIVIDLLFSILVGYIGTDVGWLE